ncbi:ArsR/SmtB family transcription factor [Ornithinimicrobium pekingense]|uniref:Transcriptional regulator n=1 Tax=Ornithinimicrobium pekingense TaxID=384677 RepID=A0ABQ2F869_9MICO|nr:metalloregulator ArsR/SmtB family transcription factor [Ornithinimicrobium pekingense]GGK71424.1 transcriptional regulator [Ornithinimicrobium pekingense]
MEAFDVLGDPVRRRLLEHLASAGELSAGGLVALAREEFGISQPAVSQHLRVLREAGFVTVRADGPRRVYALRGEPLAEAERWLADLRGFWSQRLDSLETELARGRRARRHTRSTDPDHAAPAADEPRRMA